MDTGMQKNVIWETDKSFVPWGNQTVVPQTSRL